MRKLVQDAALHDRVVVDSAGTHDYHVGEPPDPRAQTAARKRGYDLSGLRARHLVLGDFDAFDLILGMDFNNLEILNNLCPPEHRSKIGLLMAFSGRRNATIVHDPYYRSAKDFELVLDYIEDACAGLVRSISQGNLIPQ